MRINLAAGSGVTRPTTSSNVVIKTSNSSCMPENISIFKGGRFINYARVATDSFLTAGSSAQSGSNKSITILSFLMFWYKIQKQQQSNFHCVLSHRHPSGCYGNNHGTLGTS